MPRCTAWRFLGAPDISQILPVGRDHSVWKPCRNRVADKGAWCEDCVSALLMCPEVEVRRQLVEHEFLTDQQLKFLTTDTDYATQHRATELLSLRDGIWR